MSLRKHSEILGREFLTNNQEELHTVLSYNLPNDSIKMGKKGEELKSHLCKGNLKVVETRPLDCLPPQARLLRPGGWKTFLLPSPTTTPKHRSLALQEAMGTKEKLQKCKARKVSSRV